MIFSSNNAMKIYSNEKGNFVIEFFDENLFFGFVHFIVKHYKEFVNDK